MEESQISIIDLTYILSRLIKTNVYFSFCLNSMPPSEQGSSLPLFNVLISYSTNMINNGYCISMENQFCNIIEECLNYIKLDPEFLTMFFKLDDKDITARNFVRYLRVDNAVNVENVVNYISCLPIDKRYPITLPTVLLIGLNYDSDISIDEYTTWEREIDLENYFLLEQESIKSYPEIKEESDKQIKNFEELTKVNPITFLSILNAAQVFVDSDDEMEEEDKLDTLQVLNEIEVNTKSLLNDAHHHARIATALQSKELYGALYTIHNIVVLVIHKNISYYGLVSCFQGQFVLEIESSTVLYFTWEELINRFETFMDEVEFEDDVKLKPIAAFYNRVNNGGAKCNNCGQSKDSEDEMSDLCYKCETTL